MNLTEIKGWANDSGNIAIYLFGHEGEKHKLEVVDSGSGDVFYKSAHATREEAVGRMCEIKGLDVPDPDVPKYEWPRKMKWPRSLVNENRVKERREKVLVLYDQGVKYGEIASMLDVNIQTINNDLRVLKVKRNRSGDGV